MPKFNRTTLAVVALVFLACPAMAQCVASPGEVKGSFGDWRLRCAQVAGAKQDKKCALVQDLTLEDRPNMCLTVVYMRSYSDDRQILRIFAPVGVVLPRKLGVKIDDTDVGALEFLKCTRAACVAEVFLDKKLVDKLSGGKMASFIVFPTPDYGVGFPARLAGFSDGIKGLN